MYKVFLRNVIAVSKPVTLSAVNELEPSTVVSHSSHTLAYHSKATEHTHYATELKFVTRLKYAPKAAEQQIGRTKRPRLKIFLPT